MPLLSSYQCSYRCDCVQDIRIRSHTAVRTERRRRLAQPSGGEESKGAASTGSDTAARESGAAVGGVRGTVTGPSPVGGGPASGTH